VVRRIKKRVATYSVHVVEVKTGMKLHEVPFYENVPTAD
jgi:hypothetical protein